MQDEKEQEKAKSVEATDNAETIEIPYVNAQDDRTIYDTAMAVINLGIVKNLYIYNQELTRLTVCEDRFGQYVKVEQVDRNMLSAMLMESVPVIRNKGGNVTDEVPKPLVMQTILSNSITTFQGVPRVDTITNVPTLMKNKKFLETPGYDKDTRTFYAPLSLNYQAKTEITEGDVKEAKSFILNDVLGDFPWVEPSDKANALSFLVTQIIKSAYDFIIPLAFITSPQAGSGKTLIADLNVEIFGGVRKSFPNQEEELRKTIFSALRGTQPTIIFDNVDTGATIKSPYLAEILTSYRHTDRILGQSKDQEVVNGRIWMATGNNLNIGGDLATRIVPIRIDPNTPNPEKREGFKLNLSRLQTETKEKIFQALTILIQDWVNKGAKEKDFTMRTFTPWASTLNGFLEHHKIPGFLENVQDVIEESDEELDHNETFLHLVYQQFKEEWFSTVELRQKAIGSMAEDNYKIKIQTPNMELYHYLPQENDGTLKNIQSIGRYLGKIKNTHFGQYKLESMKNRKTKQHTYRVVKQDN